MGFIPATPAVPFLVLPARWDARNAATIAICVVAQIDEINTNRQFERQGVLWSGENHIRCKGKFLLCGPLHCLLGILRRLRSLRKRLRGVLRCEREVNLK